MTTPELVADDGLTGNWSRSHIVDAAQIKNTAAAFPSGVTIITTTCGQKQVGMTISSFASVSLDPPLMLVCVSRTASSASAFRVGSPMGVNVLAGHQGWLAKRFASRVDDRFEGVAHRLGPHNVPLLDDVAAWMDCHIARIYDGGDHLILLARVHSVHRSENKPLLYHSGTMLDWAQAVNEQTS